MNSTRGRIRRCAILAGALVLATAARAALADKTDIVYLRNGDRVTCEIKDMERGRLKVSTDSMGTIFIEWKDVERVTSKELYVIEQQDGTRLNGSLAETATGDQLLLHHADGDQPLAMGEVIRIDPLKIDEMIIKRWDGSVSVGFDKTKANDDTSLSAQFDARRRAQDFALNFGGSFYSRSQDDAEDSLRANFGAIYRSLLEDRWYWAGLGSVERNDELGIDLRTLGGAGYGRYLVQTGRTLWSLTGGAVVVNEQRAGNEAAETSIEAMLNTDYEFFTYDTPKTSLSTSLTIYPSLTEGGRVRADANVALRKELITDLFFELSVYYSWDNEPPEEGEKTDYGLVTSLGYTF